MRKRFVSRRKRQKNVVARQSELKLKKNGEKRKDMETSTQKWQRWQERGKELLQSTREFFNGYLFYALQTLLACVFVLIQKEVWGAIVFVGLLSIVLVTCEDILPTTLPFLLLCTFTTNCYDSFDTFMAFAVYAPIPAAALIGHFLVYRKPYKSGESLTGILAVSIALVLGGIGGFTMKEYAMGAYYILGLGAGMAVAYLLMKSQFSYRRDYDVREKFSALMICMGLLCVAMIVIGTVRRLCGLIEPGKGYSLGFSPNNLSTMLMFAMPFPLYFTKKNKLWALLTPLFFGAITMTHSRGGLLFGAVELMICCVYWIGEGKHRLARGGLCVLAACAFLACFGKVIINVIQERLLDDGATTGGARYQMLFQAFDNFVKNPFVGTGILDDSISYAGYRKQGTMAWYHMMIPQIVGSMGLVGVAAYGFQALGRFKLALKKVCRWSVILGISYLGILLMSQVNPGEFCPLPFELLTVLLFILQEKRLEEETVPLNLAGGLKKEKKKR